MQIHKPKRYSTVPFPDHMYIPGRNHRHSSSILEGIHTFPLTEENWKENSCFLYGIDLFNYTFYWETHEAIEALWHLAGRRETPTGKLLQGIIQYAVACLKLHTQQANPGLRICSRAISNLEPFEGIHFGINLTEIKNDIRHKMLHNMEPNPSIKLHFD